MPIAFKEWAVTVRALAEGEQLLTLRRGASRAGKDFQLEHDRFFLYPTFDHQRTDLVRESHRPELARALEEGVWSDGEPSAQAMLRDAEITPARPRPDPRVGRGRRPVHDHRPPRGRRAVAVLRLDDRLRREAPRVEASPSAARDPAADLPHSASGHGQGARRVRQRRSWLELTRDLPFEGTPVLSDEEFERASEEIAAIAARSPAGSGLTRGGPRRGVTRPPCPGSSPRRLRFSAGTPRPTRTMPRACSALLERTRDRCRPCSRGPSAS